MKLKRLFLTIWGIAISPCYAAFEVEALSPIANALNGAYSALGEDPWAILYNPAQIVRLEDSQASFSYSRPGLEFSQLQVHSFSGIFTRNCFNTAYGIGLNYFNTNVTYREWSGIISLGERWGELEDDWDMTLGTNLKILSLKRGDGSKTNDPALLPKTLYRFSLDLGMNVRIENFYLGVAVRNVIPVNLGVVARENLPQDLRVGLGLDKFWEITHNLRASPLVEFSLRPSIMEFLSGAKFHYRDFLQFNFGGDKNKIGAGCTINLSPPHSDRKSLRFSVSYQYPLQSVVNQGTPLVGLTFLF